MCQQRTDPFVWDNKEYVFLHADDVYSLFDPDGYGLVPSEPDTSCYKGFIVHFKLKKSQLYLSKLEVYCEDGNYPLINKVKAHKELFDSFYVYRNLNLPLKYTGNIVIGTELKERYRGRTFTGLHSYEKTYDLHFVNGVLGNYVDSSDKYFGF
ncbi:MAG: hypothetical protein IKV97_01100 [Clostridia bacterium]|nr:hypothetical protein [Clostridia bacterium]